jgi:hypothetical protein
VFWVFGRSTQICRHRARGAQDEKKSFDAQHEDQIIDIYGICQPLNSGKSIDAMYWMSAVNSAGIPRKLCSGYASTSGLPAYTDGVREAHEGKHAKRKELRCGPSVHLHNKEAIFYLLQVLDCIHFRRGSALDSWSGHAGECVPLQRTTLP